MTFDPSTLTWTCHVCHEERPDAAISVLSKPLVFPGTGVIATQNIRYCNDRAACKEGATAVDFAQPQNPSQTR